MALKSQVGIALAPALLAAALLSQTGCGVFGPGEGIYQTEFTMAQGTRFIGANKSALYAYCKVRNWNDVSAKFEEWSYRILEGDRGVFEINSRNWPSFKFRVSVHDIPAISGKNAAVFFGWVIVSDKYWTGGSDDTIVTCYEDGDVYAGAYPDRILFTCRVRDEHGHLISLQESVPFEFHEEE
ncbi:MAG: hypothetical protein OEW05_04905 [Candidatus Aminicenantes bacterium]|nr:hypothetical protein [Candidatus Aminicenantes bacterium]